MAEMKPPSIIGRIVIACLGLLLAAWAIQQALLFLASVWIGLVIMGVLAAAVVVFFILRNR